MKGISGIAAVVAELIGETVRDLGYVLWDVEYVKEGAEMHLRITIDSPNGINITDCEAVARAIDPILDEADPIENSYRLDVSSPGIERELRTDAHILASIGLEAEARLFAPVDGKRIFRGKIAAYEDGKVTLDCPEGSVSLGKSAISKLRTVFFD